MNIIAKFLGAGQSAFDPGNLFEDGAAVDSYEGKRPLFVGKGRSIGGMQMGHCARIGAEPINLKMEASLFRWLESEPIFKYGPIKVNQQVRFRFYVRQRHASGSDENQVRSGHSETHVSTCPGDEAPVKGTPRKLGQFLSQVDYQFLVYVHSILSSFFVP
jgi:hypothetical protein